MWLKYEDLEDIYLMMYICIPIDTKKYLIEFLTDENWCGAKDVPQELVEKIGKPENMHNVATKLEEHSASAEIEVDKIDDLIKCADSLLSFIATKLDEDEHLLVKSDEYWKKKENRKELFESIKKQNKVSNIKMREEFNEKSAESNDDPLRFLSELIQNADDCNYDTCENELHIEFKKENDRDCVILAYPEKGFTYYDIISLAGINQSNKIIKYEKIGEKGRGFKSVFEYFDEVKIASNEYNFSFNRKTSGIFVPQYIDEETGYNGTQLTLYLRKDLNLGDLWKEFRTEYGCENVKKLYSRNPVFFTRNFTTLHLTYENEEVTIKNTHRLICEDDEKDITEQNAIWWTMPQNDLSSCQCEGKMELCIKENGEEVYKASIALSGVVKYPKYSDEIVEERYKMYLKNSKNENAKEELLKKLQNSLPIIMFGIKPVNEKENKGVSDINTFRGHMYTFLPTSMNLNMPFIFQAPFDLLDNRSCAKEENKWNAFLFKEIWGCKDGEEKVFVEDSLIYKWYQNQKDIASSITAWADDVWNYLPYGMSILQEVDANNRNSGEVNKEIRSINEKYNHYLQNIFKQIEIFPCIKTIPLNPNDISQEDIKFMDIENIIIPNETFIKFDIECGNGVIINPYQRKNRYINQIGLNTKKIQSFVTYLNDKTVHPTDALHLNVNQFDGLKGLKEEEVDNFHREFRKRFLSKETWNKFKDINDITENDKCEKLRELAHNILRLPVREMKEERKYYVYESRSQVARTRLFYFLDKEGIINSWKHTEEQNGCYKTNNYGWKNWTVCVIHIKELIREFEDIGVVTLEDLKEKTYLWELVGEEKEVTNYTDVLCAINKSEETRFFGNPIVIDPDDIIEGYQENALSSEERVKVIEKLNSKKESVPKDFEANENILGTLQQYIDEQVYKKLADEIAETLSENTGEDKQYYYIPFEEFKLYITDSDNDFEYCNNDDLEKVYNSFKNSIEKNNYFDSSEIVDTIVEKHRKNKDVDANFLKVDDVFFGNIIRVNVNVKIEYDIEEMSDYIPRLYNRCFIVDNDKISIPSYLFKSNTNNDFADENFKRCSSLFKTILFYNKDDITVDLIDAIGNENKRDAFDFLNKLIDKNKNDLDNYCDFVDKIENFVKENRSHEDFCNIVRNFIYYLYKNVKSKEWSKIVNKYLINPENAFGGRNKPEDIDFALKFLESPDVKKCIAPEDIYRDNYSKKYKDQSYRLIIDINNLEKYQYLVNVGKMEIKEIYSLEKKLRESEVGKLREKLKESDNIFEELKGRIWIPKDDTLGKVGWHNCFIRLFDVKTEKYQYILFGDEKGIYGVFSALLRMEFDIFIDRKYKPLDMYGNLYPNMNALEWGDEEDLKKIRADVENMICNKDQNDDNVSLYKSLLFYQYYTTNGKMLRGYGKECPLLKMHSYIEELDVKPTFLNSGNALHIFEYPLFGINLKLQQMPNIPIWGSYLAEQIITEYSTDIRVVLLSKREDNARLVISRDSCEYEDDTGRGIIEKDEALKDKLLYFLGERYMSNINIEMDMKMKDNRNVIVEEIEGEYNRYKGKKEEMPLELTMVHRAIILHLLENQIIKN